MGTNICFSQFCRKEQREKYCDMTLNCAHGSPRGHHCTHSVGGPMECSRSPHRPPCTDPEQEDSSSQHQAGPRGLEQGRKRKGAGTAILCFLFPFSPSFSNFFFCSCFPLSSPTSSFFLSSLPCSLFSPMQRAWGKCQTTVCEPVFVLCKA